MDVRVELWRRLSTEELMLSNCGVGEDYWESLGWKVDQASQSYGKSILNIHRKDWCWSWSSNTLATWYKQPALRKRPWYWESLKAGGESRNRGWDGWMALLTQWTWIWANSGRQWRTEKPGVLQFMGLQRVGHNLATEKQQVMEVTSWVRGTNTSLAEM